MGVLACVGKMGLESVTLFLSFLVDRGELEKRKDYYYETPYEVWNMKYDDELCYYCFLERVSLVLIRIDDERHIQSRALSERAL